MQQTLTEILNDPQVMPNLDCRDLLTTIQHLEFGRTVREIFIELQGSWKIPWPPGVDHYEIYRRRAEAEGRSDIDLTDVACSPRLLEPAAAELRRRLRLPYQPQVRCLSLFLAEPRRL